MKKLYIIIILLISLSLFSACNKDFESYPIGYGLVNTTQVAKSRLRYISRMPYNVNELELTIYYLPSIWAEVEYLESEKDNILNYVSISGVVFKYYAKYIIIGDKLFTGVLEPPGLSYNVSYFDENENNLLTLLETEEFAKFYVESIDLLEYKAVNSNQIPIDLKFTLNQDDQLNFAREGSIMLLINYAATLDKLPDFFEHYRGKGYDKDLINLVFERAYLKAKEKEFISKVY